jgi:Tol biopolymer transport system component
MKRITFAAFACLLHLTAVDGALAQVQRNPSAAAPAEGPVARRVLPTATTEDMESAVDPSPDGRHVAYVSGADGGVYVRDIASGAVRQVVAGSASVQHYAPVWSPDGRRLAFSVVDPGTGTGTVSIVDVATRETSVLPVTQVPGCISVEDWSRDGRSLLCNPAEGRLALLEMAGTVMTTLTDSASAGDGSLSPDGRFVAYAAGPEENTQIFIQPVAGGTRQQITWMPGRNLLPLWAPDGRAIAFQRDVGVWVIPMADGAPTGDPRMALSASGITLRRWTRGGLYYVQSMNAGLRVVPYQVFMDPATGGPAAGGVQVLPGYRPDTLSVFAWSPDMQRIAFGHRQSPEVTVVSVSPRSVATWDLGRQGHVRRFLWSGDGREVFYEPDLAYWRPEDLPVLALDASTGRVRELFPRIRNAAGFSLSADGRSIAFYRLADPAARPTGVWPSAGTWVQAVVVAATGQSDGRVVATAGAPGEVPFSSALRPVLTLRGDRLLFVRQAVIDDARRSSPQASGLWIVDSDGRGTQQLAAATFIQSAIWDPTGRFIAYTAKPDRTDGSTVARVVDAATGAETEIPLPGHLGRNSGMYRFVRAVDWSRDGTRLGIIAGADLDPPWEFWVVQGLEEGTRQNPRP